MAERATPGGTTRVVEALAGPVMAAAGIDASNTGARESYLLLPADPDAAAARLLADLRRLGAPVRLGLLVSDTAGRPWRVGQTDFALGAAGLAVLDDRRGQVDADGRPIAVTARAVADELAAAADLVKGKAWQVPAAVLRDLPAEVTDPSPGAPDPCDPPRVNPVPGARSLVRTGPGDWFALGHVEAVRAALGVAPGSPESEAVGLVPVHDEPAEARLTRVARLATHAVPGATWALVEAAPPTDSPADPPAEPTARQSAIQVSADTPSISADCSPASRWQPGPTTCTPWRRLHRTSTRRGSPCTRSPPLTRRKDLAFGHDQSALSSTVGSPAPPLAPADLRWPGHEGKPCPPRAVDSPAHPPPLVP
ncbi:coenzyme F420-0:L-glutamate ligase [Arsenicicoccus piscis]|uniref:coenzyme F420-0:L-glutamate ligase n=1 Tax=Arsenicicoccus piscis TaxID=673954 RepID=UPI0024E173B9|nr:coenzyme F420-0:L-glutamate ligase [Arsenicicoccus piscis]